MNAADLRALVERVAAMPAVARLSPGPWGTVAVHWALLALWLYSAPAR